MKSSKRLLAGGARPPKEVENKGKFITGHKLEISHQHLHFLSTILNYLALLTEGILKNKSE